MRMESPAGAGPEDDHDWYSNETATFGDRLSDAREALGMSRAELARRLGVKETTLGHWEDDLSEPRANRVSMLAGLLNVSLRWLMTGEGEGLSPPLEREAMPAGMTEMLGEMRSLQRDLIRTSDRLGHLEKRLRRALAENGR